jgi:hypothetical protein
LIGFYNPVTSPDFCDKEEGDIWGLYSTYLSPLIDHCCIAHWDSSISLNIKYQECALYYESPVVLSAMKKVPIYNFKFSVYHYCLIYTIWYPNPDEIGNF